MIKQRFLKIQKANRFHHLVITSIVLKEYVILMVLQQNLTKQKLLMATCLKLLESNLKRLNNLSVNSSKRLSQLYFYNMGSKCQLMAGLLMNIIQNLLLLFNQQELVTMSGQEIKEVINIVESIKHQILMARTGNFGNLVFKRQVIMIFQPIQSIYVD